MSSSSINTDDDDYVFEEYPNENGANDNVESGSTATVYSMYTAAKPFGQTFNQIPTNFSKKESSTVISDNISLGISSFESSEKTNILPDENTPLISQQKIRSRHFNKKKKDSAEQNNNSNAKFPNSSSSKTFIDEQLRIFATEIENSPEDPGDFQAYYNNLQSNITEFKKNALEKIQNDQLTEQSKKTRRSYLSRKCQNLRLELHQQERNMTGIIFKWRRIDYVLDYVLQFLPVQIRQFFYQNASCTGQIRFLWILHLFITLFLYIIVLGLLTYGLAWLYQKWPGGSDFQTERQELKDITNVWYPPKQISRDNYEKILGTHWQDWKDEDTKNGYMNFEIGHFRANATLLSLTEILKRQHTDTSCTCAPLCGIPINAVSYNGTFFLSPRITQHSTQGAFWNVTDTLDFILHEKNLTRELMRTVYVPNRAYVKFIQASGELVEQAVPENELACIIGCLRIPIKQMDSN